MKLFKLDDGARYYIAAEDIAAAVAVWAEQDPGGLDEFNEITVKEVDEDAWPKIRIRGYDLGPEPVGIDRIMTELASRESEHRDRGCIISCSEC